MKYNKDNPLRVFEAFAGYSSQSLALQRLKEDYPKFDFVRVGWAEFDPQSKKPIDEQPAVIANRALFPDGSRNFGDITCIMFFLKLKRPAVFPNRAGTITMKKSNLKNQRIMIKQFAVL